MSKLFLALAACIHCLIAPLKGQEKDSVIVRIPISLQVCGEYFSPKQFEVQVSDTSIHPKSALSVETQLIIGYSQFSEKQGVGEFILTKRPVSDMEFSICPGIGFSAGYLSFDYLLSIDKIEIEINKILFSKQESINNISDNLHYLAIIRFIGRDHELRSTHCSIDYKLWEKDIRRLFNRSRAIRCDYLINEGFKISCK